jgi:hypothetical protein
MDAADLSVEEDPVVGVSPCEAVYSDEGRGIASLEVRNGPKK